MRGDDAIERRDNLCIAVVDLRDCSVCLRLQQVGARIVPVGRGIFESGFGGRLAGHKRALSLELRFRLLDRSLRTCFRRLRLVHFQLVGFGLDGEQLRPFLDEGAVLIVDRLQKSLHACHEINGFDRRGIAGDLEIARDRALHGNGNIDLGRRWRHESVLLAACERDQSQNRAACGSKATAVPKDTTKRTRKIHDNALCFSAMASRRPRAPRRRQSYSSKFKSGGMNPRRFIQFLLRLQAVRLARPEAIGTGGAEMPRNRKGCMYSPREDRTAIRGSAGFRPQWDR
jgi:hypothetical protein